MDSDGFKNTMKSMDTQVENLHTQEDVINLLQWAAERAVQEHDRIIRRVVDPIKRTLRPGREARRSRVERANVFLHLSTKKLFLKEVEELSKKKRRVLIQEIERVRSMAWWKGFFSV